jgi:glutamyl-tRNA reductase
MQLILVGTSYQRAPVELRELLAYDPALRREALGRLAAEGAEAAVLSTCNRTEVYGVSAEPAELEERIYGELAGLSGLSHTELAPALYSVSDEAAAVHLFRVAAGLDSMVPGEAQILGQVREAYEAARETATTGATLHRLFRQALRVGKRVRTETAIGENPASVSSAAAQLAERVFEDLAGRRILLLGAGKTADLTAANLISRGVGEIVVANRSPERAEALARRFGGRAVGLDRVEAELVRADVVVASTSSQGFVLSAAQVERAVKERRGRPIFFIDIAVPRDVDPAVIELEGCYLYDIDDLERVVAESVAGRREEAVRAEAIVSEEADSFRAWQLSLDVVPAISSLRARAESIRREELERAQGRLASLSPSQRRAVEALTSQIVAKLLHQPTVRMKEAAAGAEGVLYADAVRHLFGLGDDAGQARKPRQ